MYTYENNISTDEWIKVLNNVSIINQKMLDILKIIYQFENHSATTLEISLVREKLGHPREKSYNPLIVQNAKRVKDYLNKDALINEDGEEVFWGFFFDGEYLKGKGVINTEVKVGKSFDSGGWSLTRTDLNELIPIDSFEGNYPIVVDGIPTEGRLNLNTRLFYKGEKLRNHLEDLFNENPNQKIPIQIEYKDENKKGFEFKLKKELIEAIETLYDTLEVKYPHSLTLLEEFDEDTTNSLDDFYDIKKDVSFYDYLLEKEFLFDKETIENYLLSLKVKPFAILTGNSGTGKTKLSQLFSQYLMENHPIIIEDEVSEEYITFKTKNSYLNKDFFGLGNKTLVALLGLERYQGTLDFYFDDIKSTEYISVNTLAGSRDQNLVKHLMSLENLDDVEIKINKEDLNNTFLNNESEEKNNILTFRRKKGKHNFWSLPKREIEDFAPLKQTCLWRAIVDGIETTIDFWLHDAIFAIDNSENEHLKEYISQKSEEDMIEFKVDFSTFKQVTYHSDLGVEFLNENNLKESSNYKIIPVGANWTENRHIVGYYNVITNEYQDTPAYKLIEQANNSQEPHFLILAEMNLSHVERYFADFLSTIESGEKIPLYGEEELTLPPNLFIIGTVNVDETTYMFSPKVLDRANVIEFETYSASDYMNNEIDFDSPSGNIEYLENPLVGNEIRDYGIDELRDLFEDVTIYGNPFWNILSDEIYKFQSILSKSGFDFGFRVINEIVRFMAVAWEYEGRPNDFPNWARYFDACIKQKLLPKLHGSQKVIGETLDELLKACLFNPDGIIITKETAKYYTSAKKLDEMRTILRKQRYVSFIN